MLSLDEGINKQLDALCAWYFPLFLMNTLNFLAVSLISFLHVRAQIWLQIVSNSAFTSLCLFMVFPSWTWISWTNPYELISILLNYNPIMQEIIMQILSQILDILMQKPVLRLKQGPEPNLCIYYNKNGQSGIISSWMLKTCLKAGKRDTLG